MHEACFYLYLYYYYYYYYPFCLLFSQISKIPIKIFISEECPSKTKL